LKPAYTRALSGRAHASRCRFKINAMHRFSLLMAILAPMQILQAQINTAQFINVSVEAGLSQFELTWGHSWGDINGDGLPDLFVSNHYRLQDNNEPYFYYNLGNGTFQQRQVPFRTRAPDMHGSGWFDFDNDGDQDLLVETGRTKRNFFLINQGGGAFTEAAVKAGLDVPFLEGRTPLFIDQNRDGLLDVIHTAGIAIAPDLPSTTMSIQTDSGYYNLSDFENDNLDELSTPLGFLADLDGDGQLNATIITSTRNFWYQTGCLPLELSGSVDVEKTVEAISGDFNGDLLPDLYFVRNDPGQSIVTSNFRTNYQVFFGINLINPTTVTAAQDPSHGEALVGSNGILEYTPNPGYQGLDSVYVTYCDSFENCDGTVIRFDVQVAPLPGYAGGNFYPVLTDSLITVSIPKLTHPYRFQTKASLRPASNDHNFTFRVNSDSVYIIPGIPFLFPPGAIAIGSEGYLPDNEEAFFLLASDTINHGLAPYTPGAEKKMYIGYSPAKSAWTVNFNSDVKTFFGLISIFTTRQAKILSTTNFDSIFTTFPDRLLANTAAGFADVTDASGLGAPNTSIGVVAGDFDNDMDLDIYLSTGLGDGNMPNEVWDNQGDGTFVLVPGSAGAPGSSLGAAGPTSTADYDRNGFLDLFVEQGRGLGNETPGPYELFRNAGNANHWIGFDLEGTVSNRDGIGAVLTLFAGGRAQLRVADGGMHRFAQNESTIHFGLGPNLFVDSLIVRWPSGIRQAEFDLPADQYMVLVEPVETGTSCFPPTGLEQGTLKDKVGLRWYPAACAQGYQVSWRNADSATANFFQATTTNQLVPNELLAPNSTYFWKVRAFCQDSTLSQDSRPMIYTSFANCPAPDTLTTALYWPDSLLLSWDPVQNVQRYQLYFKPLGAAYFQSKTFLHPTVRIPTSRLTPGSTFEWFVQPTCYITGAGDSSAIQTIAIPTLRFSGAWANGSANAWAIQLQPNPAANQVKVQHFGQSHSPANPGILNWQLLDPLGRMVLQGQFEGAADIDVRALPEGLYWFTWHSTETVERGSQPLQIVH